MSSWSEFLRNNWQDLLQLCGEHLLLVLISTSIAVAIGIPLGILLTRYRPLRAPVLGVANVMQTVPSLALFGFLIPLPFIGGIGARTAIVALVLYALLPLIRNTVTGILGVDKNVREAAVAMGMTNNQILWQVELPLAASVILTGVRVAVVISVGVATIAAAVGAGGLGTYIFRGLRQNNDIRLILAGAVPAALMALAADYGLGLLEKYFDTGAKSVAQKKSVRVQLIAFAAIVLALLIGGYAALRLNRPPQVTAENRPRVVVGSKDFTESVLLAEIFSQMLEARGVEVVRQYELGGSIAHQALVNGEIDSYPEYTGTSYMDILKHPLNTDARTVYDTVRRDYASQFGVEVGPPLGYENTFAILVRGEEARRLNLKTISEAAPHARNWRAGFGQDFMSRADGYPGFARTYKLQFAARPSEMDLSLTYRALAERQVDLIAGNSTDGLIPTLDLFQLEDDLHYFPPYEAVFLIRKDALARAPAALEVLEQLKGAITTEEMRRLNYQVDGLKRDKREVAREWIAKTVTSDK
ncbi:MAG TPA: ABC transporter permease/substrate-binding protein [Pyrinomonadaceae bacterium]